MTRSSCRSSKDVSEWLVLRDRCTNSNDGVKRREKESVGCGEEYRSYF